MAVLYDTSDVDGDRIVVDTHPLYVNIEITNSDGLAVGVDLPHAQAKALAEAIQTHLTSS